MSIEEITHRVVEVERDYKCQKMEHTKVNGLKMSNMDMVQWSTTMEQFIVENGKMVSYVAMEHILMKLRILIMGTLRMVFFMEKVRCNIATAISMKDFGNVGKNMGRGYIHTVTKTIMMDNG